jgi:8-oxo-dGTP diphosphatase
MSMPRTPSLTADCVVFNKESVLLIERRFPPFKGLLALPGGFVDADESVESGCVRELAEETGLILPVEALILVGVYSLPGRDPRGATATVAFAAEVSGLIELRAGDDAANATFESHWESLELAFDHREIISNARSLLQGNGRAI